MLLSWQWLSRLCLDTTAPGALRLRRFVWGTILATKVDRLKQVLHTHTQAFLYLLVCVLHFACMHCDANLLKEEPRTRINNQGIE